MKSEEISTDPTDMLLALHNYDVPCVYQLVDLENGCDKPAKWLVRMKHTDAGNGCPDMDIPFPACTPHYNMMESTFGKHAHFWLALTGSGSADCATCGGEVEIASVKPIGPPQ